MASYRVTYKMNPPGEFGDAIFVTRREISRYTPQMPHEYFLENKADWAGKTIIAIEQAD